MAQGAAPVDWVMKMEVLFAVTAASLTAAFALSPSSSSNVGFATRLGTIVQRAVPEQGEPGLPKPILLQATPAAPYQAVGSAQFAGGSGRPGDPYMLTLQAQGISAGNYSITALRRSNRERLAIGSISVVDPTATPDRQENENDRHTANAHQSASLVVQSQIPLPTGINPADISQIAVTDIAGNDVLVGTVPP